MKKILVFFLFSAVWLFAKSVVTVSILPQKYFVKQICGDILDVNVMVGKGVSPATYEPKPKQMGDLQKSDIYFAIGVPYERVWLKKFSELFPKLDIVKSEEGIKKLPIFHHHGENHEATILDPHVWLDPLLVKTQAKNIAIALIRHYPEHKSMFEKNLKTFEQKLDKLNEDLSNMLKDKKGATFFVYHPSWGYFAKRYELNQMAIEVEGKEPKPKELADIINEAKEHKVLAIFVQPQFSKKSAKTIAKAIGGKVITIDQLSEDWENELRKSVSKMVMAF